MYDKNITRIIESYPLEASDYARKVRRLIHSVGAREGFSDVQESLKWGEPSFSVPGGSPFRMDWKEDDSGRFQIYFNCRTSLVDTFRTVYSSVLDFEGTRAIKLSLTEPIPSATLEHCFALAMNYHRLKNIPLLGV